ncbi:DYHA-like protein [Mya arenaria]|uniref:DYHA-like protein n=1 Tax=Mya arenaria TaxID=6604 RepID=A0ABY7E7P1_MYAAR|nr:DYHA-like protein [Mya arenaria]
MQLTLADFDCKDDPPEWLPQEKWEDILALSVLPGPLDSLCVNFAMNSDPWKSWYKGDYPEREPLPLSISGGGVSLETRPGSTESTKSEKEHSKSPDLGPLSEFHQLLLIRMLRPDRLPVALAKHTKGLEAAPWNPAVVTRKSGKVDIPACDTPPAYTPSSSEVLVEEAIDTADKNDGWVVIEDLHLAPEKFFNQLKKHLVRVFRSREKLRANNPEEKQKSSKFCVWITSEPCEKIPNYLILKLHKVKYT